MFTALDLVSGFPSDPPAAPTLPPNKLAFDNCDWVADCDDLQGKIPIPCPGHCDHFLLCIDNRPTMQQCDPITSWLFWSVKTNFNPLSLQCEKDFKTCDWYQNVRLTGSKVAPEEEVTSTEEPSNRTEFNPLMMKTAADAAMEEALAEVKAKAEAATQQLTVDADAIVDRLQEKAQGVSEQVQEHALKVLQQLKDEEASNSKELAQLMMRAIIDQIRESSDRFKDGIVSVVDKMHKNVTTIVSELNEKAVKVVENARDNLFKLLPNQEVQTVSQAATNETDGMTATGNTTEPVAAVEKEPQKNVEPEKMVESETKSEPEKASEPEKKPEPQQQPEASEVAKPEKIAEPEHKEDSGAEADPPKNEEEMADVEAGKMRADESDKDEELMQGDEPPREENVKETNVRKGAAPMGSSANYFVFTLSIFCLVVPHFL